MQAKVNPCLAFLFEILFVIVGLEFVSPWTLDSKVDIPVFVVYFVDFAKRALAENLCNLVKIENYIIWLPLNRYILLFLLDLSQSELGHLTDSLSYMLHVDKIPPLYPSATSFFLPELLTQARGRISFQTRQRFDQDNSYNFVLTEFKAKDKFLFQYPGLRR